jgi:MoaA/NifB/PqqE/SkfB family radical SAM enzyme
MVRMTYNQILVWLGKRRLRNVQIALTYACNHHCTMCSSSKLINPQLKLLNSKEWKRTVDELYALGCTHFDITGGEPTLHMERLLDLIAYASSKFGTIVSLATNGSLLTQFDLRTLKSAGLNSLLVDIQAGDHDAIVGRQGNKTHNLNLIHYAKSIGLNACINTCLGSYNIDAFEGLLELSKQIDVHVLTNLAAPTGELEGEQVRITEFMDRYYDLMKRYPLMRSDTTFNWFGWDKCPGGREKIYITAYGEVIQCTFVQISYGNVKITPLRQIYDRMWSNPRVRTQERCKHTFNKSFRDWIDYTTKDKQLPVRYDG